jgi:hypothetical protein
MTAVMMRVPEEVVREAEIPYEGVRDVDGVVFAIEGINFTASVITLATLRRYAPALISAIRRWRLRQETKSVLLTVRGNGIDLRIELPPNLSTQDLLKRLGPLLRE